MKNVQVPPPVLGDGVGSERKLWVWAEVIQLLERTQTAKVTI
jgi:hypothetical protein